MLETNLIKGCKNGESKALKAFVDTYSGYIYTICYRYMGDREMAKDALQESLVQIVTKIHKYQHQGKFKAWISTVTVMKCLDLLRKEKRHKYAKLENVSEPSVDESTHLKLEQADVMKFIETIPENNRVAINMFLVEGYSHKEIAERLSITESSSRSLVSRGRKMILAAFRSESQTPKKERSPYKYYESGSLTKNYLRSKKQILMTYINHNEEEFKSILSDLDLDIDTDEIWGAVKHRLPIKKEEYKLPFAFWLLNGLLSSLFVYVIFIALTTTATEIDLSLSADYTESASDVFSSTVAYEAAIDKVALRKQSIEQAPISATSISTTEGDIKMNNSSLVMTSSSFDSDSRISNSSSLEANHSLSGNSFANTVSRKNSNLTEGDSFATSSTKNTDSNTILKIGSRKSPNSNITETEKSAANSQDDRIEMTNSYTDNSLSKTLNRDRSTKIDLAPLAVFISYTLRSNTSISGLRSKLDSSAELFAEPLEPLVLGANSKPVFSYSFFTGPNKNRSSFFSPEIGVEPGTTTAFVSRPDVASQDLIGLTTQFRFGLELKGWRSSLGLRHSYTAARYENSELYVETLEKTASNASSRNIFENNERIHRLHNSIDLMLGVGRSLWSDSRNRLVLDLAASYNIYAQASGYYMNEFLFDITTFEKGEENDYKSQQGLGAELSVSYERRIGQQFSAVIRPYYSRTFNPINNNISSYKLNNSQVGLLIGLSYSPIRE